MAEYRGYEDIPADHWAARSEIVDYAVDRGLLADYDGTNDWVPDDTLTRGQLAVIMYRICMPEVACYRGDFADGEEDPFFKLNSLVRDEYYHYQMSWAYHNGLILGNGVYAVRDVLFGGTWYQAGSVLPGSYDDEWLSSGSVEPYVRGDDAITREELATMLFRMEEYRGTLDRSTIDYAALDSMPDGWTVSDWAREAVAWAVGNGIIAGRPGIGVDPQANATRAEAGKMLMVCLEGKGFVPSEHGKRWVDGRVYCKLLKWTCFAGFGYGCGATSWSRRTPSSMRHGAPPFMATSP